MKVDGDRVVEFDRRDGTLTLPSSARYIGQCACPFGFLVTLNLEGSHIIKIEEYAFAYCSKLKEIIFPSHLQEICEGAFSYCKKLKIIKYGSESMLNKIGAKAFYRSIKYKRPYDQTPIHVEFPPLLEFIGDFSFNEVLIQNINLQRTLVRHIGSNAFNSGSIVSLPATVTPKSIINCYQYVLDVDEKHPYAKKDECGYLFVNGTIIKADKTRKRILIRRGVERIGKLCFYRSNLVSLTIPSSVTKISDSAFSFCKKLRYVHFAKNSRLNKIGRGAFACSSLKKIKFPKSLIVIKCRAFSGCNSLKTVLFPNDSQLERIGKFAFLYTAIEHLSLPPSIKKINDAFDCMNELESIYVRNELYVSNEERTAILTADGSKYIFTCPNCSKIPEDRKVFGKRLLAFEKNILSPSIEIIEERSFGFEMLIIEFAPGSKLKYLDFEAFTFKPKSFIINNENFITMDNGVVMSLNPRGIVFVPNHLTEIEIDQNVEVIYSNAFENTKIKSLSFPKSLKIISSCAFKDSELEYITFEEGTDIETLGKDALSFSKIKEVCIRVNGKIYQLYSGDLILPPNFSPDHMRSICPKIPNLNRIYCPRSSLLTLTQQPELPAYYKIYINDYQ